MYQTLHRLGQASPTRQHQEDWNVCRAEDADTFMKAEFDARLLSGLLARAWRLAKDHSSSISSALLPTTLWPSILTNTIVNMRFLLSVSLLPCICFLCAQAAPAAIRPSGDAQLFLTPPMTDSRGRQRFMCAGLEALILTLLTDAIRSGRRRDTAQHRAPDAG